MSGAQFWRISTPRGVLLLRRWPAEHPTAERLQFIHTVITHAADSGLQFVPAPIRTSKGNSFVLLAGHLWELAPWMPGDAAFQEEPTLVKLTAAMRALASFHGAVAKFDSARLPIHGTQPNAIVRHYERLRLLIAGDAVILANNIDDALWPELGPLAKMFLAHFDPAARCASGCLEPLLNSPLPIQPCIRDVWHDHLLFTGDAVTGLIDFGAVAFDTPATDVARLLGSLVQYAPMAGGQKLSEAEAWRFGIESYESIRPLTADEHLAAEALKQSGPLVAGCNWIRWIYVERRQFENPLQVLGRLQQISRQVLAS
jgi:Ser/Thr protein kinase RdoA (MazF antagonist)